MTSVEKEHNIIYINLLKMSYRQLNSAEALKASDIKHSLCILLRNVAYQIQKLSFLKFIKKYATYNSSQLECQQQHPRLTIFLLSRTAIYFQCRSLFL